MCVCVCVCARNVCTYACMKKKKSQPKLTDVVVRGGGGICFTGLISRCSNFIFKDQLHNPSNHSTTLASWMPKWKAWSENLAFPFQVFGANSQLSALRVFACFLAEENMQVAVICSGLVMRLTIRPGSSLFSLRNIGIGTQKSYVTFSTRKYSRIIKDSRFNQFKNKIRTILDYLWRDATYFAHLDFCTWPVLSWYPLQQ